LTETTIVSLAIWVSGQLDPTCAAHAKFAAVGGRALLAAVTGTTASTTTVITTHAERIFLTQRGYEEFII
jgi:hypothetical protein